MTYLYRVQVRPITDDSPETPTWLTEWFPDKAGALEQHAELLSLGWPVRTSKHYIPSDRDSLCQALNLADVNFSVWEGEEIRRDEPETTHAALHPMLLSDLDSTPGASGKHGL